jgi:hypothetical protein
VLTWLATEILTGQVIEEVPDLIVSTVKQTIGKYESANATLPLPTAPVDWLRATLPYATCLHLLDDDIPVWGGVISNRPRDTFNEVDGIALATIEAYFDRRYVGDETYEQVGQNLIVKDLVEKYAATGNGVTDGIPIRVVIVNGGDGKLRDRTYADDDDKTLYSILTELSGVLDGPEWTVGWEWQHNPERITPVLYVGDRIGNPVADGLEPNAVFEVPGPLTHASLLEDWTADKAANDFLAVSTAIADVRPESQHVTIADPQRPTLEMRFTPSTSIEDTDTLDEHANKKAALLGHGTNTLSMQSVVSAAPKLGQDWFIGDDIGFVIGDMVPGFPGGSQGVVRANGFQFDLGSINYVTPLLDGDIAAGVRSV